MGVPNNRSHIRTSPVTISIRDLFSKINPKDIDFLKYVPNAFLNEDMLAVGEIESTADALEELAKTDRNLFQRIVDVIRDFIRVLRGQPQTKSLVKDLEYIEKRLARVYDSADTKKAAKSSAEIKYSTGLSFKEQLQQMIDGTFDKEHSHLFVRKNTPQIYLNLKKVNIPDLPIVMSYDNAAISMFDKNIGTKSAHNHGLGIKTMSKIPEYMEDPYYIVKLKNGRINALLVKTDKKRRQFLISLELEVQKPVNAEYSGGYEGKQHLLLTAFGAEKRYFKKILDNPENVVLYDKEKDSELRGNPESKGLNIINNSESNDIILNEEESVKNNISKGSENYSSDESFSIGSPMQETRGNLELYESGERTEDEYLLRDSLEKYESGEISREDFLKSIEDEYWNREIEWARSGAGQKGKIKAQNKERAEVKAEVRAEREEKATKQSNIEHIRIFLLTGK